MAAARRARPKEGSDSGSMLARNQRSATMNPPGVAGHTGGIRGPSPGADVEARACRKVPGDAEAG